MHFRNKGPAYDKRYIVPPFRKSYSNTSFTLERHRRTEGMEVIASSYISVTWLRFSRQERDVWVAFAGSVNAKSFLTRETYFTKDLLLVIWKDESWDINLVVYTFQFDLYNYDFMRYMSYHFYKSQNSDEHKLLYKYHHLSLVFSSSSFFFLYRMTLLR